MKIPSVSLLLLLLAGCSSQPMESNTYYLLRSDAPLQSRQLQPSTAFALGSLSMATYLDQSGLVLETNDGEIHAARTHLWAEPLRLSVRKLLATEISRAAGEDILFAEGSSVDTRIDIIVDQLHGNNRGEAILVAYWRLQAKGGDERSYQFAETWGLTRDGYAELAKAERKLLQQLAQRIAQSLGQTTQE